MNDQPKRKTADPAGLQDEIRDLLRRAEQGDRTILTDLRRLIDANAPLWNTYGDIAQIVESALVHRLSGSNLLMAESTLRKLTEMKAQLADPAASPLDQLLVARLVYCWLESLYLDGLATQVKDAASPQLAWLRRYQEGANRRFLRPSRLWLACAECCASLLRRCSWSHALSRRVGLVVAWVSLSQLSVWTTEREDPNALDFDDRVPGGRCRGRNPRAFGHRRVADRHRGARLLGRTAGLGVVER
jgi:hypothetical protein